MFSMKFVIVGLGNPGKEFEKTRHNAGAQALLALHKKFSLQDFRYEKKHHGQIAEGEWDGKDVILLAPDTFMNNSGIATKTLVKSKKALERMIVLYDDLDLALGTIRVSFNRSSGGHNGLKSISKYAGTDAYIRVRIGISPEIAGKVRKPKGAVAVNKYVLSKWGGLESETFKKTIPKIIEVVETILKDGKDVAMNKYN